MIGQVVSHYRILERVGGGGMGVVYKAEDTRLKRIVALKFLPPELTRDPEANERFMREAQAASSLDHSNICDIHDIGETTDGQLFIVMTCYEGETLKKKIERGPLKIEEAVDIAIQIVQGLGRAHEAGIIHRDIKPANIMVTPRSEVRILDFGLAKLSGQTVLTKTGSTVGTAAYMSPEQSRGEHTDQRTDLWSCGAVFYEMLSGERPFKGEYDQVVLYSILNLDAPPLSTLRSDVPEALNSLVAKCLEKTPAKRFQTAGELEAALRCVKHGDDTGSRPSAPGSSILQSGAVRRKAVFIGIPILILIGILLIWPGRHYFSGILGLDSVRTSDQVAPGADSIKAKTHPVGKQEIPRKNKQAQEAFLSVSDTVAPRLVILTPKSSMGGQIETQDYSTTVTGIVYDEHNVDAVYVGGTRAQIVPFNGTEVRPDAVRGKAVKFSAVGMLAPGENRLEVRAFDVNGNYAKEYITVNRISTQASSKRERVAVSGAKFPNTWGVIIGIAQYQDKELQLAYADKDAQSFYNFLKTPAGGSVSDDHLTLLTNQMATKPEVIRRVTEKLRGAAQDDEIIIYLACHSVPDEANSELYFVGYDSSPTNIQVTGISQRDIQRAIADGPCKNLLFIFDACRDKPAAFRSDSVKRNPNAMATTTLFQKISRVRRGVALMTASSRSEFSSEGKTWGGHGVFTYHLVKGLQGPADFNDDGLITLREIFEYVSRHVVEDTEGRQHPELTGTFDNELLLSIAR